MQTETLDKLYLEWSQFTQARNRREIEMQHRIDQLLEFVYEARQVMDDLIGLTEANEALHNRHVGAIARAEWLLQERKKYV